MTEEKANYGNVIKLETLPVINFKGLKGIGELVEKRINAMNIDNQVATEETLKSLKEMKATLNKDFAVYETQRKELKKAIEEPYKAFMLEYDQFIKKPFTENVPKLTSKIAFVEDDLKKQKKNKLVSYFEEYCASASIDFLKFENVGLNITRSGSDNKLKKEIADYVDKIAKDVALISQLGADEDYTAEVTADFYLTLDAAQSIANVNNARNRKAKIAEQQKAAQEAKEAREKAAQEAKPKEEPKREPLQAPTVEVKAEDPEQRVMEASFTVKASIAKLRVLKQYMIDNDIEIL